MVIVKHLSADEVIKKYQTCHDEVIKRRWKLILFFTLFPTRTMAQARDYTGHRIQTIREMIRDYNEMGVDAIEGRERGNCLMTLEEEKAFLDDYWKSGHVRTNADIQAALEVKLGRKLWHGYITKLLKRHNGFN